jgi:hypothetical protein
MARDTILITANLRKQYVMDATRKVILSKHAEQAVSHILWKKTRSLHWTGENSETDSDGEVIISTLQINSVENRNKAIFVAPKVDGVTLNMELDTGSAVSVIATGARSYIFTSPGICKKRREDTVFAAQSESRISAPFFASKTVYSLFIP